MITEAVGAVEGVSMVFPISAPGGSLTVSYHTELSAGGQPKKFQAQLQQAVLAAVPGFVRADPAWENLIVWPLPPDGYPMVTIPRQAALDWYTGKIDNAAFEKTWKTE